MAQDYDININVKGLGAAAKQLSDFTDELNKAREEGASVSGALDMATGGAVTGFKNAASGVKTFIKGLKMTRAALIATGIGAFVVIVGSLISAFMKTEKVTRKLEQVFAGIGAALDLVRQRMAAVGGYLVNLFTKGHTAAAAEFKQELAEMPESIDVVRRAAQQLTKDLQNLTDAQIEMIKRRAEDRAQIKKYNMVAEDTTKTLEEREAAAQKAIAVEKQLMADRLALAEEELRIHEAQMEMSENTEEDRRKQAELAAEVANLQTESVELQTTLNNKLNTIRNEAARKAEEEAKRIADAAAEKAKAEQEAADAILKAEQDIVDALDMRQRESLSALEKELLAEEDIYNKMLDAAGENAELITQIESQRDEAIQAIFAKHNAETIQKRDELNEALAARRMTEREKEIADHDKQFYELLAAAGTNQELRLAVMDQYATEVNEMQERHRQEDLDNERAAQRAKRDIVLNSAVETMSVLKNLNEAFSKGGTAENKKAFERNKAISIAETLVSTYMAAQKAFTSQLTATPDSPIRAALAAAAATASGVARVAAIKRTQFNEGGGGGAAAGGSAGGIGGSTRSIGVDVGTLIPNQETPTPEPVRAYVVENEISNKQALNREMQIQTTL